MLPQGAFPFLASPVLLHCCPTVASLPPCMPSVHSLIRLQSHTECRTLGKQSGNAMDSSAFFRLFPASASHSLRLPALIECAGSENDAPKSKPIFSEAP